MTFTPIRAIVFDLGGTLEDVHYDDAVRLDAARGVRALMTERGLDPGLAASELHNAIRQGLDAYQRLRESTNVELPPERVWIDYVFADRQLPADRLTEAAEDLMLYYENHAFKRTLKPEAAAAVAALHGAGFRLAIISNVVSRTLVPRNLDAYGLTRYFDPIVTSAGMGIRKPHPRIFADTARQMLLPPAVCAYVGDTISRDVAGAQRAGYGMTIQIKSFLTSRSDRDSDTERPDAVIQTLNEIGPLIAALNRT